MNYVLLVLLVATGLYDLYLAAKKRPTLSQQYQKLFPTWFDMVVFAAMLFTLLSHHPWMAWQIKVIIAAFGGHLFFPNKEKYNEGDLFNYFNAWFDKWLHH